MSRKLPGRFVTGVLGALVFAQGAWAQQQGGTGGGTATGGTQTTGSTGTQTQTGDTGGTTYTGAQTGGGGSAATGTGAPIGGASGPAQFSLSGTGGSAAGRGTGTRGTIGGQRSQTGAGRATGIGTNIGGAGRTTSQQTNRQNSQRAQYVTRFEFAPASPQESQVSTIELRASIEQSLTAAVPTGVSAVLDGSAVILKGTVSSSAESKLAERMMMLEPGVRSVKNELVVAQGSSASGR